MRSKLMIPLYLAVFLGLFLLQLYYYEHEWIKTVFNFYWITPLIILLSKSVITTLYNRLPRHRSNNSLLPIIYKKKENDEIAKVKQSEAENRYESLNVNSTNLYEIIDFADL